MNATEVFEDYPEPPPDPVYLLTLQVEQLTRELNVSRGMCDGMQLTFDQERARWQRENQERAALILSQGETLASRTDAVRRASASLMVALQAIDTLLKALTDSNMQDARRFFPGEVFRAMQDAEEVLKAYGIPF